MHENRTLQLARSAELKTDLEREAQRRKLSVSTILDMAARDWLKKSDVARDDEEEQRRLHKAASGCFGVLASGDAHRSEHTSENLQERLRTRYGRWRLNRHGAMLALLGRNR